MISSVSGDHEIELLSSLTAVRSTTLDITWSPASVTFLQLSGLSMIFLRIFTPSHVSSMLTLLELWGVLRAMAVVVFKVSNEDTMCNTSGKLSTRMSGESHKTTLAACPRVFSSSLVLFFSPSIPTTFATVSEEARSLISANPLYLCTPRMRSRIRTPTRRSATELDLTISMAKLTMSMFMASRTLPPEHFM
ncbi:uncharacterized protein LOC112899471 [Panicum hallii]|uniref:uncharacterized protein LOC112899471 n=1 Tax=Panicum hallii TaxID=206008 RepID=UPI000DF4EE11|nr:uncharacterized protein LOC112899471 [Panicum hallii]